MTLEEKMHINGYVVGNFSDKGGINHLEDLINNITNDNIKSGFSLKEKYKSSLDLKPNVFLYDEVFMNILFDNNIHKMINKATGVNLYLVHIQLRIAYPSSKGGYIKWHRDTHFYNNHTITGNIPPVYKLIHYPALDGQETRQLGIIKGSHNFIFNSKLTDMLYARIAKPIIISSDRSSFIFFNTSVLHKAINPVLDDGSVRLIYSFAREDQLSKYDGELPEMYKNRLKGL